MFGQRLKELREEKGLTQKELAKLVDLSQQTIGHYEVERTEPNPKVLQLLADIFDTTTDYLLGRSNSRYLNGDGISDKKNKYLAANREKDKNETELQSYIRQAEERLTPQEKMELLDLVKLYTKQADQRRNKKK